VEQGPGAGLVGSGGAPAGDVRRGKVEKLQGEVGRGLCARFGLRRGAGRSSTGAGGRRPAAVAAVCDGVPGRREGSGVLEWGVMERGGAGTRGGEVNGEERGCRGELPATR
jgi:hypothetical protein